MEKVEIPIWLDAGVDDLFVGKAVLFESSIQLTISSEVVVGLVRDLTETNKIRSLTLVIDREDPGNPQTPEQLEYHKRVMGENYG
jgi:hypothetical protein